MEHSIFEQGDHIFDELSKTAYIVVKYCADQDCYHLFPVTWDGLFDYDCISVDALLIEATCCYVGEQDDWYED